MTDPESGVDSHILPIDVLSALVKATLEQNSAGLIKYVRNLG